MWLGLLAFLTILHRNTVTAEAEQTTTLTNVSSTVITEPLSNISPQSSVNTEIQPNTQLLEKRTTTYSIIKLEAASVNSIISKEIKDIMVNSTALLYDTKAIPEASSIRGEIPTRTSSKAKMASSTVYRVQSSPQMLALSNSKIIVVSVMPVQVSTTNKREASTTLVPTKERNENTTQVIVPQKHSVSMIMGSSVQPKQQTVSSNTPHKSKISIPLVSSLKREQSSATLAMHGKINATHTENKRSENFIVSMPLEKSKIMMLTTTPVKPKQSLSNSTAVETPPNSGKSQLINITASTVSQTSKSNRDSVVVTKENASIIFSRANASYTKIEVSASYSKNFSKALIKANSTTGISSFEVKQASKTVVLEPSPSLATKQSRSKINVVLTSPVVNMSELLHSKMSKDRIHPTEHDTMAQHSISRSALVTYIHTLRINATKENLPGKTISLNESKTIHIEISKAMHTKVKPIPTKINLGNVTTSSPVIKLDNKTLISNPVRYISSSEMYVPSGIPAIANRTTMTNNIPISGQFSKISSNQTHIAGNFTTYGVIRPSISLSSFYKTVTKRTDEIQVSPLITVVKNPEASSTMHASGSTYSMRKVEISDTIVEIKPTSTALFSYSTIQYSTQVSTRPTSLPLKVQQFPVTIRITSETFRNEYKTSARAFRKKSREIAEQFDQVFKDMAEYLFTEVLRLFNGSLGCDVVIHTESVESKPVSVEKINNTLNQAKSTKGGFGKFVVGDIDVKEKSPDVQGREEDKDEKETWGRMPIIVISILAGLCLVLLVMVITQCIQKRHYSHSLAESNEIQEYSPAIPLKYNDDSAYKDEERVPMTTFNQTDIY